MPVAFLKASLHPTKGLFNLQPQWTSINIQGHYFALQLLYAQTFILILEWKSFLPYNCLQFRDFWLTFTGQSSFSEPRFPTISGSILHKFEDAEPQYCPRNSWLANDCRAEYVFPWIDYTVFLCSSLLLVYLLLSNHCHHSSRKLTQAWYANFTSSGKLSVSL